MNALAFPDAQELCEYWNENPPASECLRAFVRIRPQRPELNASPMNPLSMRQVAAEYGGGILKSSELPADVRVVLESLRKEN